MDEAVLFPSTPARRALASRFGLPYDDAMQDWEWEVANPDDFDLYLAAYTLEMPAEQRFSLMEMLLQCVEDYLAGARHPLSVVTTHDSVWKLA